MYKYLLILISALILSGCGRSGGKMLDEAPEKDSSFKEVLDAKTRIENKVSSLREDYKKEKESFDKNVAALKEELRVKKNNTASRIAEMQKELAPKIRALKSKLASLRAERNLKKQNLKNAISKMKNIKKLLKKKEALSLSADEVSIWNKRQDNLSEEMDFTKKELARIRDKTRLLEAEIKILSR